MIILDTNVVSALMRDQPDKAVREWLDRQPRSSVWITAVSVLEIRFGLALMVHGRRRSRLEQEFAAVLGRALDGRIAPFDTNAAEKTADLLAERRRSGRTVELRDAMIAGTAIARYASLATRNTRHFSDLPVAVVDPWTA